MTFGTSYKIRFVVPGAQANLFYVVGWGRGGAEVIERWEIETQDGGFFADRSLSNQPIGVPIAGAPLTTGIVGGQWVYPVDRTTQVTETRTEILRDTSIGFVMSAAADPDGRFLLAVAGPTLTSRSLYRIDIGDDLALPVQVLTSASFASLDHSDTAFLWETANGVRSAILEALGPSAQDAQRAVLLDAENDGLFDPPIILTIEQWVAGGLDDDGAWSSKFIEF